MSGNFQDILGGIRCHCVKILGVGKLSSYFELLRLAGLNCFA
jgi:hypothetical protein